MNNYDIKQIINAVNKVAGALTTLARAQSDLAYEARRANEIKERLGR